MQKPPKWIRLITRAHLMALGAGRLVSMLRDDSAWAFSSEEDRSRTNAYLYSKDLHLFKGGRQFEAGLFAWEEAALKNPPFPDSGSLLVGGAGAGREAIPLHRMGFEVLAFDPCEDLAKCAGECLSGLNRTAFVLASYRDLIRAVEAGEGPLAGSIGGRGFDAAVLGWGSFSHVLSAEERLSLLSCLRRIVPHGPVLLSFLSRSDTPPPGRVDRLRRVGRAVLRSLGASGFPGEGDVFYPGMGFAHLFTPEEIKTLAQSAGYRVASGNLCPSPHAVLVPEENSTIPRLPI